MFKYSSTHVLNSVSGIIFNDSYDSSTKTGETAKTIDGSYDKSLVVDHDDKFYASAVKAIAKALPVDAQVEKIHFTMPDLTEKANCRLYVYIRTVDGADPLYANDWIYKGKPFQIEFAGGKDAATSAANLAKNAGKWLNFVYGKKVLKVTADGSTVNIEVADGNVDLRFFKIEVQEFKVSDELATRNVFYADGGFETVAGWYKGNADDSDLEVTFDQEGNSGFGTGMWILKNLRLPTNANEAFMSINSVAGEMPVIDGKYVQYIITQCTERPEVQGTSVIGQYNKSITHHVLWVLDQGDNIKNFETELKKLNSKISEAAVEDHAETEKDLLKPSAE